MLRRAISLSVNLMLENILSTSIVAAIKTRISWSVNNMEIIVRKNTSMSETFNHHLQNTMVMFGLAVEFITEDNMFGFILAEIVEWGYICLTDYVECYL